MQIGPNISQPATQPDQAKVERMREAAEKLEATFLSEMLKSAGLDRDADSFGGGIGESQFASLLRDEQAKMMVAAGGIGLAEKLFESLMRGQNAEK